MILQVFYKLQSNASLSWSQCVRWRCRALGYVRLHEGGWRGFDDRVESQKVALSALGQRRMKNVDKNIDKRNKQWFGWFECNYTHPKRRFWKQEQKLTCGFRRKHLSRTLVLNLEHGPVKSRVRLEHPHYIFCSSFQNLGLGSIKSFMALWRVFRPKSLLFALIDVLIYVFQTHFDRGLKLRLFGSPHCR